MQDPETGERALINAGFGLRRALKENSQSQKRSSSAVPFRRDGLVRIRTDRPYAIFSRVFERAKRLRMSRVDLSSILASILFWRKRGGRRRSHVLRAARLHARRRDRTPVEIGGLRRYRNASNFRQDGGQNAGAFTHRGCPARSTKSEGNENSTGPCASHPFDLGPQTFPALPWTLTDASGATDTLQSPPVKLEVTGPDIGSSDLRDIKGPLRPPLWTLLLIVFLAAVTLGLAGYEVWVLLRPADSAQAGKLVAERLPPRKLLDALEDLQGSGLGAKKFTTGFRKSFEYISNGATISRRWFSRPPTFYG